MNHNHQMKKITRKDYAPDHQLIVNKNGININPPNLKPKNQKQRKSKKSKQPKRYHKNGGITGII